MPAIEITADTPAHLRFRSYIQRTATGPHLSKDLSFEEARDGTRQIIEGQVPDVQAAIFFIALRMKRETDAENRGVLQAIRDVSITAVADVPELIDIADPYDGYNRSLPASPFLPAVLAAAGLPAVSHGLESVGPKWGITHRKVLRAAGIAVDLTPAQVAARVADPSIGWGYVDQAQYCKPLHDLVPLRQLIIKRPTLTTTENMVGPIRASGRNHLFIGYVHKAYPEVYASLARQSGFDNAIIVRGIEGGVIPSLRQPATVWSYQDMGAETPVDMKPQDIGIEAEFRATPIPENLPKAAVAGDDIATEFDVEAAAKAAAEAGIAALRGEHGMTYDSLVYAGATVLWQTGHAANLQEGADRIRTVLDNGSALGRFK
ncbi:MAG: anthranilate phosphoribosyltransferase [Gammaproteobacteria bacterium]|nr:anthranilate phosphoribosyltransferase [Gammaproteobacteria bacterium]